METQEQELNELRELQQAQMIKFYWDSMNQSMNECLDSGEVDRETLEPMPKPATEESIEAWGERNFPAEEVEEGGIIFSLWSDFKQTAQNKMFLDISEWVGDLRWLHKQANPPAPRQADIEITPANIPEELIDMFANDAWETDSGAVDWEKTFESLLDDSESTSEGNHFEIWTSKVTYIIKEENDYKGPLEYGSKTLRKIQKLTREARC
jgi:hypothetical protein